MPELFEEAFARILEDIADVNKPADAVRTMEFKISFRTDEEREHAGVLIESKVKLAARKAAAGYVKLSLDDGELTAYVTNPKQEVLDFEPATLGPEIINGGE